MKIKKHAMEINRIRYDNLVIEITRRCNMKCAHCMRGGAQPKDISHQIIDKALRNVDHINEITFTGGEPTLNIDAIEYILKVCKERNISVTNYFIATNGKHITDRFITAMAKWHAYVVMWNDGYQPEVSSVALSKDMFHEDIKKENIYKLMSLQAFDDETKKTDFNRIPPIDIGRAKNIDWLEKRTPCKQKERPYEYSSICGQSDDVIDIEDTVVITCDGDILYECDYAYADAKKYKVGDVYHMSDFIQKVIDDIIFFGSCRQAGNAVSGLEMKLISHYGLL